MSAFVAARRCKVSTTHLLPLVGDAGASGGAAV